MENKQPSSRKKFILAAGALAVLGAFLKPFRNKKDIISCGPAEKSTKVMLTEDGQLVEIDEKKIIANSGKITDKGLQSWIKKNEPSN